MKYWHHFKLNLLIVSGSNFSAFSLTLLFINQESKPRVVTPKGLASFAMIFLFRATSIFWQHHYPQHDVCVSSFLQPERLNRTMESQEDQNHLIASSFCLGYQLVSIVTYN